MSSSSYPRYKRALLEWSRMLGTGSLLVGLYVWLGGLELLFLVVAVGVLMIGGLMLYLFGPKRIDITRVVTPIHVVSGESVKVTVQVSFRSRIPLPWMTITDRWSGGVHQELLFPGFRSSFNYTYCLPEVSRGFHHLEYCSVRWGDLPGWFTGMDYPKDTSEFKVLPSPLYFRRMVTQGGYNSGELAASSRSKSKEEGMDIRPYMPGDPLSRIHWKSSARHGVLHSRTPEQGNDRMICIVLDNAAASYEIPFEALAPRRNKGKETPAFEKAVSAAMGLMLSAERSGAYVQLFSGGWPEGMARHEGIGKIPGRVLNILTEIMADSTRNLSQLLDDASRGWIPGMSIAVVTGRLEPESAKVIARLLAYGMKVNLYYAWDGKVPESSGRTAMGVGSTLRSSGENSSESGPLQKSSLSGHASSTGTIGDSLARLGAGLYSLDHALPTFGQGEEPAHEPTGKPEVR